MDLNLPQVGKSLLYATGCFTYNRTYNTLLGGVSVVGILGQQETTDSGLVSLCRGPNDPNDQVVLFCQGALSGPACPRVRTDPTDLIDPAAHGLSHPFRHGLHDHRGRPDRRALIHYGHPGRDDRRVLRGGLAHEGLSDLRAPLENLIHAVSLHDSSPEGQKDDSLV